MNKEELVKKISNDYCVKQGTTRDDILNSDHAFSKQQLASFEQALAEAYDQGNSEFKKTFLKAGTVTLQPIHKIELCENTESPYGMKLNEEKTYFNGLASVTCRRVPGGWVYTTISQNGVGSAFVPYFDEYDQP